ncbi:MAG: cupin domain-containing protein [Gammaproteobacteria bacterium]
MSAALPPVLRLGALPADLRAERITELAAGRRFHLEHILSGDHASAPGFWYDQADDEWAILLSGRVVLEFEAGEVELGAGDAVLIPAHLRHRVARSENAIWLALHVLDSL